MGCLARKGQIQGWRLRPSRAYSLGEAGWMNLLYVHTRSNWAATRYISDGSLTNSPAFGLTGRESRPLSLSLTQSIIASIGITTNGLQSWRGRNEWLDTSRRTIADNS